MARLVVSGGFGVLALLALIAGPGPFATLTVIAAAAVLVDLNGLLARAAARPVLLAAAVPAVALPAVVATDPAAGWARLSGFFAAGFLLAALLMLVFGRRSDATAGLGTTLVAALIAGVGASTLLLLVHLPAGFRWVLATGLLAAAADVAVPVSRLATQRQWRGPLLQQPEETGSPRTSLETVGAPAIGVAVMTGLTLVFLAPPLDAISAVLLGLAALVGAAGGDHLQRALAQDAGLDSRQVPRLGEGLLLAVTDGVLLTAPAAYILARAASL